MSVKSLSILNFRNIGELTLSPSEEFNFLIGPNGSGKSNLLESIYLFFNGRSFRKARFQDMLNHGSPFFRLSAAMGDAPARRFIYYECDGRPKYGYEGAESSRGEFFGDFHPFVLSREIFNLFYYGSADTRRFFDGYAGMFDPSYRRDLARFNRVLRERNALLKTEFPDPEELKIWDQYFSRYAALVEKGRRGFCAMINDGLSGIFSGLFADIRDATIVYEPSLDGRDPSDFISEDLRRRATTRGPHRDNYRLVTGGRDMCAHASQGQMKSFVISFLLGVADLLEAQRDAEAVILLDDIFEELDPGRKDAVYERIRGSGRQVFLTMAEDAFSAGSGDAVFRVEGGAVHG